MIVVQPLHSPVSCRRRAANAEQRIFLSFGGFAFNRSFIFSVHIFSSPPSPSPFAPLLLWLPFLLQPRAHVFIIKNVVRRL